MLTQDEVKRAAHLRRLRLVDQIWKDYLQDLLLHLLARKVPGFVFGGGTAIWKLLGGDRFSEDIDGYARTIPDDLPAFLQKELGFLGVSARIQKQRRTANMLFLSLALSLPSHPREVPLQVELLEPGRGSPRDSSRRIGGRGQSRSRVAGPRHPAAQPRSQLMALHPPYPDIPPVELRILAPAELLANKVAAILGRDKPRDVHDLYTLLKRGIPVDRRLVREKAPRFSLPAFEQRLAAKRRDWPSLEPLLVTKLPAFEEERSFILAALSRALAAGGKQ